MKQSAPGTSKISKEAKEAVQDCVSEFISFITSEAAEKCHEEKRKTIGGEDVLYAMMMLGFEQYVEPLKIYLSKMRQVSSIAPNIPSSFHRTHHFRSPFHPVSMSRLSPGTSTHGAYLACSEYEQFRRPRR